MVKVIEKVKYDEYFRMEWVVRSSPVPTGWFVRAHYTTLLLPRCSYLHEWKCWPQFGSGTEWPKQLHHIYMSQNVVQREAQLWTLGFVVSLLVYTTLKPPFLQSQIHTSCLLDWLFQQCHKMIDYYGGWIIKSFTRFTLFEPLVIERDRLCVFIEQCRRELAAGSPLLRSRVCCPGKLKLLAFGLTHTVFLSSPRTHEICCAIN
jgi:hypothetical protein